MKTSPFVLITGGSTGLGKELVLQCAARGFNVIIISLPCANVHSLAEHIQREYGVQVVVYTFDLTDHTALQQHLAAITQKYPIQFLINNAGIGGTMSITDSTLESIDRIIQLNIRSTVMITRMVLPHLLQHDKSYIMNISSMAAFTPIAWKTVYPASKAFISSFSLGIREEMQGTGLSVSVVYPGPIMTNSNTSSRILLQGMRARIGLLSTAAIARKALNETLAGKAVIIPGWWNRINYRLLRMLPVETTSRLASGVVKKELAVCP